MPRETANSILFVLLFVGGCSGQEPQPLDADGIAGGGLNAAAERPRDERSGFNDQDFAAHVNALKSKIPDDEPFHLFISKPFVVIGNGTEDQVRRCSEDTVQWAVEHLKKDYFDRDPKNIIDIWLFKDKSSYERYNEQLFGSKPTTPFGYYSSEHRALVMNIATGGGTLVHEIVHPFIESNFPGCPSWFNEGLASLYEQSSQRDGHIIGLTNWRLAGLKAAIQKDALPTFHELCHTTPSEFYSGSGVNYAQARYLCYYLQEQGKLLEFYKTFRANHTDDASGYQSLVEVLGKPEMSEFERTWKQFVLKLRFP